MQVIGTTLSVQFPNTLCYLSSIKYDRHNFNKNCWNNRWFECSGETKLCFSHTLFAGHQDYSNLKRDFNNTCCLSWRSKNQEKAKNFVMEVNKKVSSRHLDFFLKKSLVSISVLICVHGRWTIEVCTRAQLNDILNRHRYVSSWFSALLQRCNYIREFKPEGGSATQWISLSASLNYCNKHK